MQQTKNRNMRFLIVDHIKPSQDILKQFVMQYPDAEVDRTHYAQDVATICQQKSYDVILLGYDLGEHQKNGQQILEELRVNNYINRHCIVILITAEISQSMVLAALEHKPDHYLCKPYSLSDLSKRLTFCLGKKKAMHSIYQALDKGKPLLVIKHCEEAIANGSPYKTECMGIIARQYFELGRFSEAKEIYKSHQDMKNCQWATIGLGKIALLDNKLDHAEKLFKWLIQHYPLYLSSYDWLAVTYEEQFHFLFAEDTLQQALKLSPRSLTRLQKYASLCIKNNNYGQATTAYESNYHLAHNSIHHCADNTIKYVQALILHSPSLSPIDVKKANNKAFSFIKTMTRDFREVDVKIQSHLLSSCLFERTREGNLASDELLKGHKLFNREQESIAIDKLDGISVTLNQLNKSAIADEMLKNIGYIQEKVASNANKLESQVDTSIKSQAQEEIQLALTLYSNKQYSQSIFKLKSALRKYPNHLGIKLNLLQVALVSYEEGNDENSELKTAKKLISELTDIKLSENDSEILKKMQKKYQQVAGI